MHFSSFFHLFLSHSHFYTLLYIQGENYIGFTHSEELILVLIYSEKFIFGIKVPIL